MAAGQFIIETESVGHRWGWFLFLGIVMLIFGAIALIVTPAATLGTVMVLGWLLAFAGILQGIHAFQVRKWTGFFLHLLAGILSLVVGLLVVTHPVSGALVWTLLFASYFMVLGIFQMVVYQP